MGVFCWSQSRLSLGKSRVHPGQLASSSHWWERPPCKVPTTHREQFGVQQLPQGHFNMQLSSARSWDLNQRPATSHEKPVFFDYLHSILFPLYICFKRLPGSVYTIHSLSCLVHIERPPFPLSLTTMQIQVSHSHVSMNGRAYPALCFLLPKPNPSCFFLSSTSFFFIFLTLLGSLLP